MGLENKDNRSVKKTNRNECESLLFWVIKVQGELGFPSKTARDGRKEPHTERAGRPHKIRAGDPHKIRAAEEHSGQAGAQSNLQF